MSTATRLEMRCLPEHAQAALRSELHRPSGELKSAELMAYRNQGFLIATFPSEVFKNSKSGIINAFVPFAVAIF